MAVSARQKRKEENSAIMMNLKRSLAAIRRMAAAHRAGDGKAFTVAARRLAGLTAERLMQQETWD